MLDSLLNMNQSKYSVHPFHFISKLQIKLLNMSSSTIPHFMTLHACPIYTGTLRSFSDQAWTRYQVFSLNCLFYIILLVLCESDFRTSWHGGSLEITLTVPLKVRDEHFFNLNIFMTWHSHFIVSRRTAALFLKSYTGGFPVIIQWEPENSGIGGRI